MEETTQQAAPTGAERKADPWRSDEIGELCKALAQCQAKIQNPKKGKTANAGKFKYNYADISDVVEAINKVAPEFGLSHSQIIRPNHEGRSCIFTMVMHESGQWLCSEYKLPPASDNHEMGGNITYGRRYTLAPMFGIASEEDTDFNGAHCGGDANEDEAAKEESAKKAAEVAEKYRTGKFKKVKPVPPADSIGSASQPSASQTAPAASDAPEATKTAPETEGDLKARLAASKAKAINAAKEHVETEKAESEAIANEHSLTTAERGSLDYSGIHAGLAKKLKEYDNGKCDPIGAFNYYVCRGGFFGPDYKGGVKGLPSDFCDQVLSQWDKVAPKFVAEIVPF